MKKIFRKQKFILIVLIAVLLQPLIFYTKWNTPPAYAATCSPSWFLKNVKFTNNNTALELIWGNNSYDATIYLDGVALGNTGSTYGTTMTFPIPSSLQPLALGPHEVKATYKSKEEYTCPVAESVAPPPANPPPASSCTPKGSGKKVEITYMKYSSTDGRCGLSWTGVGFQYYYFRTPDKGECTNGKCVDSIKVECNLDQAVGDKQIRDAAIAFAKIQRDEDVYINGVLTCDITISNPLPPGPPCAQWKDDDPKSGVCLKVATSLFQGGFNATASGAISTDPAQFIVRIFSIVLGFAGGIALLLILSAGYKLITSKGKPESIQQGKDQLISAIVGLVFIIFSFIIFQLIFSDILKIPGITN